MTQDSMFVVLEGLNGCGKTSIIENILVSNEKIARMGFEHIYTNREIGGTKMGEHVRQLFTDRSLPVSDANTELLLINAARRENLRQKITPNMDKPGVLMLCDRYIASSYAYQVGLKGLTQLIYSCFTISIVATYSRT